MQIILISIILDLDEWIIPKIREYTLFTQMTDEFKYMSMSSPKLDKTRCYFYYNTTTRSRLYIHILYTLLYSMASLIRKHPMTLTQLMKSGNSQIMCRHLQY